MSSSALTAGRSSVRRRLIALEQFSEAGDHEIGPFGTERIRAAARLDSDDETEAACTRCRNAGRTCLEGRRLLWRNAEHPAGGEWDVGCGFRAQLCRDDRVAVHALLDQGSQSGAFENRAGVGTRRDHRAVETGVSCGLEVAPRALKRAHPLLVDLSQECFLLAIREPVDGFRAGRILRVAIREADPTAGKEGADALMARLAVHVALVVGAGVERHEASARPFDASPDELVECLYPGSRVEGSPSSRLRFGRDTSKCENPARTPSARATSSRSAAVEARSLASRALKL